MFGTALVMALAAAQPVASEPQGPPATTPMTAQSGAATPSHSGALNKSSTQQIETIQPAPAAGQSATGVTSYPASFFTQFQPNTATDMINNLPGFVFDDGDSVRGFAGAAGNVLIDGVRPTSKSDDLYSILRRIPASQVERIDLIRGGARRRGYAGQDGDGQRDPQEEHWRHRRGERRQRLAAQDGRLLPGLRPGSAEPRRRHGLGRLVRVRQLRRRRRRARAGGSPPAPDGTRIDKTEDKTRARRHPDRRHRRLTPRPRSAATIRVNGQLFGQTYIYDEVDPDVSSLAIQPIHEHDHQNKEQSELGLTYDRSFGPKLSTETLFIQQFQGEDYLTLFSETGDSEFFREGHTNGESILRSTATYTYSKAPDLGGGRGGRLQLPVQPHHLRGERCAAGPARRRCARQRGAGRAVRQGDLDHQPEIHPWKPGCGWKDRTSPPPATSCWARRWSIPSRAQVLTWSPDMADQFRFRVEEEVSQLDFNDFVAAPALNTGQVYVGNPNLVPQQALVLEAAYERRFWKSGDINITYRHSDLTDVIDRAPVLSPTRGLRQSRQHRLGDRRRVDHRLHRSDRWPRPAGRLDQGQTTLGARPASPTPPRA